MTANSGEYPSVAEVVGATPVVRLQRLAPAHSTVLAKLEGANPAGSVKDRAAFAMIGAGLRAGTISPGDHLIEATSGNTGIALAAAAAVLDVRMTIVMPRGASAERRGAILAYGAELVETDRDGGMELARDTAAQIVDERGAHHIDQFSHPSNPGAHYEVTAREIWDQSRQRVSHVVSAMGTTGTVTGLSRAFAEIAPNVRVIGVQPAPGDSVPGIRTWPPEYVPRIYDGTHVAEIRHVSADAAMTMTRRLARSEGLLLGPSSGGAATVALDLARENTGAVVLFIAPDRGDRYLSTGIFADSGDERWS